MLTLAAAILFDLGGPVAERIDIMRGMDGVRIDGVCVSACTLYLGLPETCVTPEARLGFHSPSTRSGLPLPREEWERVTRQMAAYYPPAIREWFMADARYQADPVFITGRQAINAGATPCNPQ